MLGIVASIFYFRITASHSSALVIGGVQTASIIASLLNAVQIQVVNYIYGMISIQLNDWENHRTDVEYEDSLIGKIHYSLFYNKQSVINIK